MKRLLFVDDDVDMLALLREHFDERYEVVTARDGAAAVERFARQRPDAVFLDIGLPGLSGVEVLKRLREADPSVPVIMLTANAETLIAEDCLKRGAFGWVPKPFDLVYLDHMAAAAVDQNPQQPH